MNRAYLKNKALSFIFTWCDTLYILYAFSVSQKLCPRPKAKKGARAFHISNKSGRAAQSSESMNGSLCWNYESVGAKAGWHLHVD